MVNSSVWLVAAILAFKFITTSTESTQLTEETRQLKSGNRNVGREIVLVNGEHRSFLRQSQSLSFQKKHLINQLGSLNSQITEIMNSQEYQLGKQEIETRRKKEIDLRLAQQRKEKPRNKMSSRRKFILTHGMPPELHAARAQQRVQLQREQRAKAKVEFERRKIAVFNAELELYKKRNDPEVQAQQRAANALMRQASELEHIGRHLHEIADE